MTHNPRPTPVPTPPRRQQKPLWFDTRVTDDEILSVISTKRWYTVRDIAERLDRSKRQLYKPLQRLAERGNLEMRTRTLPNGVEMLQYRAREGWEYPNA